MFLNIVVFKESINSIIQVLREFNFGPRPFVIVGKFGSGKKSVLKLACFIRGLKNITVNSADKGLD